jgi:hypothetical protein
MLVFIYEHRLFAIHMSTMGILSTFGQMFVYRMIKQFKQHFPPFVITTRKIFTVGLSIFYYHHETNFAQMAGLALVFAIVTYEFVSEMMDEKKGDTSSPLPVAAGKVEHSEIEMEVEPVLKGEPAAQSEDDPEEIRNNEKKIYEMRLNQEQHDGSLLSASKP